ncbi:MAG: hypothetical protein U0936_16570 [Planctomycetaceae bacterium]
MPSIPSTAIAGDLHPAVELAMPTTVGLRSPECADDEPIVRPVEQQFQHSSTGDRPFRTSVREGRHDFCRQRQRITDRHFFVRPTTAENSANVTPVGTFLDKHPDASNSFAYSLIAVPGNSDAVPSTTVGNTLQTATVLIATKSSHSIRVRTTDQGGFAQHHNLSDRCRGRLHGSFERYFFVAGGFVFAGDSYHQVR